MATVTVIDIKRESYPEPFQALYKIFDIIYSLNCSLIIYSNKFDSLIQC